jgi:DNA-binding transcriptional LysR family regulator
VARLERLLGARLLERSTRRLRLTDVGARYHEHARRVLQELDQAAATVASFRAEPQGWLRVSASVVLGQALLPPLVAEFAAQYPQVQLFVDLANRRVDLLEEGFDLAIRAGELPDSVAGLATPGPRRRAAVSPPRATCASTASLQDATIWRSMC